MTLAFSLCEGSSASGSSPWHIRALEQSQDRKISGGIDTDSLCGNVKAPYGWDLDVPFLKHVEGRSICRTCKDRYEDYLRVGSLYFEQDGKKYVRMSDIAGLERQLLEGTARITWHVLQKPTESRPFYLLEFEMARRLHTSSERWFKPELFRIHIAKEKVSTAFLQALASPPRPASSSTGTSSGRRPKASARRTTSATRR